MPIAQTLVILLGLTTALSTPVAAQLAPIGQQMQTAHYRLELQVGATEQMFSAADAAAQHPTAGEIMVGGAPMTMAMPFMNMANMRHVEVHVYSLDKAAVVTDATVAMAITDSQQNVQTVPIANMYGVVEGPSDFHYGNNVNLPPGSYTVTVTANGETAVFTIAIPAA